MIEAPTHEQLNQKFGFRVPASYHRLVELAYRLADDDRPGNGFSYLSLCYLDEVGQGACSYTAPGDFAILGWSGTDSTHYGFVLDDEVDDGRERPIALNDPNGGETRLLATNLPEFLAGLCAPYDEYDVADPSSEYERKAERLAGILREEFDLKVPATAVAAREAAWEWRLSSGAVPTEDRIGVMVPRETVDCAYAASFVWRKPGGYSWETLPPDERRLDEAERRLRRGEVGTALVLARDFRFHHWYDDWKMGRAYIRRTCDIQETAYRTLGRNFAARTIRERTDAAIEMVT
jgi:hypothetical protein